MGELVSLVFGSNAALRCCTDVITLALEQEKDDALIDRNRTARAIVFSKLGPGPVERGSSSRTQSILSQESEEDTSVDSTWGGSVKRIDRQDPPAQRLRERFWHPTRSLSYGDEETFSDNFRFFLESCDVFGGIHAFVEDSETMSANKIIEEVGDEVIGTSSLRRKCLIFSFSDHTRLTSAPIASAVAKLGPLTTSFVPLSNQSPPSVTSSAVHLLTIPHRQEINGLRLDLALNLRPLMNVPGEISVSNMSYIVPGSPAQYLGLPQPQSHLCWGRLSVRSDLPVAKATRIFDDWQALNERIERYWVLKKPVEVGANLTVDHSSSKWIGALATVMKSRVGAEYTRLTGIESDERETMAEVLTQSFSALEQELHG